MTQTYSTIRLMTAVIALGLLCVRIVEGDDGGRPGELQSIGWPIQGNREPLPFEARELSGNARLPWRQRTWPRIETAPDPQAIAIILKPWGRAEVIGGRGAAADARARTIRIVNLRTLDQAIASVRHDGSFSVELFAPAGSTLQMNTSMFLLEDLPPPLRSAVSSQGIIQFNESDPERAELLTTLIGCHPTSSPAILIPVVDSEQPGGAWPGFVKKLSPTAYCFGQATASSRQAQPGDEIELSVTLCLVSSAFTTTSGLSFRDLIIEPTLHPLFDHQGHQCPHMRLSVSRLLTPTGLPIETYNEMAVERGLHSVQRWHPTGTGWALPNRRTSVELLRSDSEGTRSREVVRFRLPEELPPGRYGISAHIRARNLEDYRVDEFDGGPWYLASLDVGNPDPPRLTCLLLGSVGPGGTRGVIAREDREWFAMNPRNVLHPERLIIPRDDPRTRKRIRYPLDPYLPLISRTERSVPNLRSPRILFDLDQSWLQITITTPDGSTEIVGPAPFVSGQHDLSVLRPDRVVPDRLIPPVFPAYGSPSLGDIYHLTGRGRFDYEFPQYGHYVIRLAGGIHDVSGNRYRIDGTYDVFVARSLDIEVFPELGTPLDPGVGLLPQVRIQPAMPADVQIRWRHYPHSDTRRLIEKTTRGRANRYGVFIPHDREEEVRFDDPGEYVCDVTVRHRDQYGVLWMASQRGASVVVTPESPIVVHGERGNRSPSARWRARWFLAGDNRFVAPPSTRPMTTQIGSLSDIDLGHTCYPYEPGDVAWLGHRANFSLFPNITFEDRDGRVASLIERRWPGVRAGEGRAGLYPHDLLPEDRRAIGEMPYVCLTYHGLPPSLAPEDVDQWGYFYSTSWRPGVGVRSQVSEDMVPTGYWNFDDPYGWQFGIGPQGDLPGDVKMNYGGGVFRDLFTGTTHYGAYASMLVLIDDYDRLGARVLPPFDGLLPGSPRSGPLLEIGGKRYDLFLTFGAVGPGAILEPGDSFRIAGVVWPPICGQLEGHLIAPSGQTFPLRGKSNAMGVFDLRGPVADELGIWQVKIEAVCDGVTSAGSIASQVPSDRWPRGSGIGLEASTFRIPVVGKTGPSIRFDVPPGSHTSPPSPLILRGRLPRATQAEAVEMVVCLPGQVVDQQSVPIRDGMFEYVYDPALLCQTFPNIDTQIQGPFAGREPTVAWFDTVTFTCWADVEPQPIAGTVLLQGEQLFAESWSGASLPQTPGDRAWSAPVRTFRQPPVVSRPTTERPADDLVAVSSHPTAEPSQHSSLLQLSKNGKYLVAVHPWSGQLVRLEFEDAGWVFSGSVHVGGTPRSVVFSPDGRRIYVSLADASRILVLDAHSLRPLTMFDVPGEPRGVLCVGDGKGLIIADFRGDQILRLNAVTGRVEATSAAVSRPAALASCPIRRVFCTISFRTGEFFVLDEHCRLLRRIPPRIPVGQCQHLTPGGDGFVYAPQTRSDLLQGGRMFDRTVFPVVDVFHFDREDLSHTFTPDLLVVPPHRPLEVAVDEQSVYLASAGSDDVLAIDRRSGFAKWHAQRVGLEPGGLVLDPLRRRLYLLTVTGQSIVSLDADTGDVLNQIQFTHDPTPPAIARGRYLFGTATDKRLTKDQWISCAVCHPEGDADGLQWDFGDGPLDTRSLFGCLQSTPLHFDGHLDEIQDTYNFTRMVMAGEWFVPRSRLHPWLEDSNAGLDSDVDALASYIGSLAPNKTIRPVPELRQEIEAGRQVFGSQQTGCLRCHPPPRYTDSGTRIDDGGFVLHDVGTMEPLRQQGPFQLDTPTLLGLDRSAPYLYRGQARTLEEVFTKFNPQDRHGTTSHLSPSELRVLSSFLRHIAAPIPDPQNISAVPER